MVRIVQGSGARRRENVMEPHDGGDREDEAPTRGVGASSNSRWTLLADQLGGEGGIQLRSKHVATKVAETAVAIAFEGTDEEELADSFLRRKYRGKDLQVFLAEEKNLAAAFRKLRVGGFGYGAALSVLKRYSRKTAEMMDDPESSETDQAL